MLIRRVTKDQLEAALVKTNTWFDGNIQFKRCDLARRRKDGTLDYNVTLTVLDSHKHGSSFKCGHRVRAACWHVHGTFFDNLPMGTCIDTRFGQYFTGQQWIDSDIGSQMVPLMASEACKCGG